MSQQLIDVFENGTVRLGPSTLCDGYVDGFPYRVQTHIHDDHMGEFDRSKGFQDLFMSNETRKLLIAERNADLEYRDNITPIPWETQHDFKDNSKLTLLRSGHMLGSCQVSLELSNGVKCGYSGDFAWPLEKVIEVDELVIDSTYGTPKSIRQYTQESAESSLQEIVCTRLRYGSVHIKAYRGTIERVLQVLAGNISVPILVSENLKSEIDIYRKYGFAVGDIMLLNSESGRSAIEERSYVRLYSKGDSFNNELPEGTCVTCSAYMVNTDQPLLQFSERAYRIALSNHADFNGTLEYIKKTGAKTVITDNTRNHGISLANEINKRLGVNAKPSTNKPVNHQ